MLDLKTLNTAVTSDAGISFNIRHPETNAKLPLSITILGADSDAYQRVSDASLNTVLKDMAKGKKTARTASDIRDERISAISGCVVKWEGFSEDGTELECTTENKIRIFGDRGYGWLLDQVDEAIRDRANFLPK